MSTKTSIKRIALVAAAALALGGVSIVTATSASAEAATFTIQKKSATKVTSPALQLTATVDSTAITTNGIAGTTVGFASTDVGKGVWTNKSGYIGTISSVTDSQTAVLAATSPAAATATSGRWHLGTVAATTVSDGLTTSTINGMTVTAGTTNALLLALDSAAVGTTMAARISVGGTVLTSGTSNAVAAADTNVWLPFVAPVVAGSYTATVQYSQQGSYLETTSAIISKTFTLTVGASTTLSTALSTAYMSAATDPVDSATAVTTAVARSGAKANGTAISQIQVTLVNADGTAASTATHAVSASISGTGFVLANDTAGSGTASARTSTNTLAATKSYIHVGTDGTAGTGTVTVSVTDGITSVTTVLGTFTVTSYGSATKLAVSTTNYTIGRAGYATGAAVAARTAAGEAVGAIDATGTVPAFIVKATDSSGNLVNLTTNGAASVPAIVSSDTTIITGGTCVLDNGSSTTYSSGAGVGYYNCNFTTSANAASGKSATLTIRTIDPAGDGTTYLTATKVVTVGGIVASEVISTDAASYNPGDAFVITIKAKDASGNPVYDGAASPAVTASKQLGGDTGLAAGFYVGGANASSTSTATATVFAPAIGGDFSLNATGKDAAATRITATATVNGSADSSLALDAANAATDAANNAYDEAQNATQAASDALAAVTALAAQVKSLIASVKKLTAAVAKLKK